MQYDLKIIEENTERRYLLLNGCGDIYKITEVLYNMLSSYRIEADYQGIAKKMNTLYSTAYFTVPYVETSITSTLARIAVTEGKTSNQPGSNYVIGKMVVVREGKFLPLYSLLSNLFNKWVFTLLSTLAISVTVLFFYTQHLVSFNMIFSASLEVFSVPGLLILYTLFILFILFHEIGHASASYKFGVLPKEIGFGFYFVFPVFYTNVTGIWALTKRRRNVVNGAGIYFQLLINIVLIIIFHLDFFKLYVFTLILANTISIVTSLIPFFRYDGYWMFSDYFGLPNLQQKAKQLVIDVFINGPRNLYQSRKIVNAPLIAYAFLNICFWIYVYWLLIHYIITNSLFISDSWLAPGRSLTHLTARDILQTAALLLTTYMLSSQIYITIKSIRYETSRVYKVKRQGS